MDIALIIVLFLILVAEFTNGWNDAPNAIATVVSTRVLRPSHALMMASVLNIMGAALSGTAVAATIGKGIIETESIGLSVIAAAVLAVAIWTAFATFRGLPISISHGLVSGLAGAGLMAGGPDVLLASGWQKVALGLAISTFGGFFLAIIVTTVIYWLFRRVRIGTVRSFFGRLQLLSSAFVAFGHGSNDGQKFMGVFALALLLGGAITEFHVDLWVILLCGSVMGLGTALGGWKVMRTMGFHITRLETVQGFAAETSAASAIQLASFFGVPLSTTHTISTSIMGVGATRRFSAVRWGVSREIVAAWLLTFPVCGVLGFVITWFFKLFGW